VRRISRRARDADGERGLPRRRARVTPSASPEAFAAELGVEMAQWRALRAELDLAPRA